MSQFYYLLVLVFSSCCLLVIGIYHALSAGDRVLKERLKRISTPGSQEEISNGETTPPRKFFRALIAVGSRYRLFNRIAAILDKKLTEADIPLKSEEFIVMVMAISAGTGALTTIILSNAGTGVIFAAAVVIMASLWLRRSKAKRLNKFNSQIGDALVLISNALRSGFSFLQAMDMVRKEMPAPLATEFGRTFQEMHLGTPTEEAMENLAQRVGSEDLDLVVTAVLIQRQVGGNLAEVLDNIAGTIRERIRIKGEIKTLTAQGRISGLLIGTLPLILAAILAVLNPTYLPVLFTHPLGLTMLGGAVVMEVIGIILIRKIINIRV
ncbi:MAG: secretion system protein [Peptococcaceae bacterium BRH_c4b]|nr:MAG: secretion system protein [Peptococcaceae bacterium BRH_c4b]